MGRKGQLTVFIIIAIVIVAGIISFFVFRDVLKIGALSPEAKEIKVFVESCIESVGEEVIYGIGENGGYFFAPDFSTTTGVPYYYSDGKNYMPSKSQIEDEISQYIDAELFFCTRNFVDFPNYEISQEETKTKTKIENERVILNVEYPISITKGESTSLIKDFENIKIPVRLGIVYDSVYRTIQEQSENKGICISCILDIALENDLYVDMIDYDDETVIFIFKDENSKLNDIAFEFVFANRYEAIEE